MNPDTSGTDPRLRARHPQASPFHPSPGSASISCDETTGAAAGPIRNRRKQRADVGQKRRVLHLQREVLFELCTRDAVALVLYVVKESPHNPTRLHSPVVGSDCQIEQIAPLPALVEGAQPCSEQFIELEVCKSKWTPITAWRASRTQLRDAQSGRRVAIFTTRDPDAVDACDVWNYAVFLDRRRPVVPSTECAPPQRARNCVMNVCSSRASTANGANASATASAV